MTGVCVWCNCTEVFNVSLGEGGDFCTVPPFQVCRTWLPDNSIAAMQEEIETLENQAVHCRDSIQRALQRSRVSRDQKLSLIDRVSAADRELLQISTHIPCAPLGLHSDSMDSAVVPALAQWSNHPVRTLHGCRSWHRPIESHMLHCPLYLESCLKSSAAWSRTTVFSFSDRLETHKAEVASQLGAASADVCWFLQTLYKTASGSHISISTGLATITCTITLLFTYLMDGFEGSLVDKEIECLDGRAEGMLALFCSACPSKKRMVYACVPVHCGRLCLSYVRQSTHLHSVCMHMHGAPGDNITLNDNPSSTDSRFKSKSLHQDRAVPCSELDIAEFAASCVCLLIWLLRNVRLR